MWILWAKFSHNIPKPYLCIECGQSYAYKGALNKYKVIHLKEKKIMPNMWYIIFRGKDSDWTLKNTPKIQIFMY